MEQKMAVLIAGLTGKEIVALCQKAQAQRPHAYAALLRQSHEWSDEQFLEEVRKLVVG